jgi:hypothetical protein
MYEIFAMTRTLSLLRNTVAVFALLAMAATSQAGINLVATPEVTGLGSPPAGLAFTFAEASGASNYNNLTTGGNTNWVSYALGVKTDAASTAAGDRIGAFNISISTAGPAGGLLQRWTTSDGEIYDTSSPTQTSLTTVGDSYWIIPLGSPVAFAQENRVTKLNNSDTTTPGFTTVHRGEVGDSSIFEGIRNYAIGTTMAAAWGLTASQQNAQVPGSVVNFAYIVFPRAYDPNNLIISGLVQRYNNGQATGPPDVIGAPEPGTLTLLSLALIGGLGFRRRHR